MNDWRKVEPLHDNILVIDYSWPETTASELLFLPQGRDKTLTIFEVVKASRGAISAFGTNIAEGDIVICRIRHSGIDMGTSVEYFGKRCKMISFEKNKIMQVIKKDW